jgi:hypothetical protein
MIAITFSIAPPAMPLISVDEAEILGVEENVLIDVVNF